MWRRSPTTFAWERTCWWHRGTRRYRSPDHSRRSTCSAPAGSPSASGSDRPRTSFEATGVSLSGRGGRLEETLDVLQQASTDQIVEYDGSSARVAACTIEPKPHQQPPPAGAVGCVQPGGLRPYRSPGRRVAPRGHAGGDDRRHLERDPRGRRAIGGIRTSPTRRARQRQGHTHDAGRQSDTLHRNDRPDHQRRVCHRRRGATEPIIDVQADALNRRGSARPRRTHRRQRQGARRPSRSRHRDHCLIRALEFLRARLDRRADPSHICNHQRRHTMNRTIHFSKGVAAGRRSASPPR